MERYKAAKANRKKIRDQQRKKKFATITIWSIIGLAFLSLIVYLIVLSIKNSNSAVNPDQTVTQHRPYMADLSSVYIPKPELPEMESEEEEDNVEAESIDSQTESDVTEIESEATETTVNETTNSEGTDVETTTEESDSVETETVPTETSAETSESVAE